MKKRKSLVADKKTTVSLINKTRLTTPRIPFSTIAKSALPKGYELSIVIINDKTALELNQTHRKKDTAANVLSFELSDMAGEIFLNLDRAKREAAEFDTTYLDHLKNLFIHGLFHLMGHDHGSTMEKAERQIRRRFK